MLPWVAVALATQSYEKTKLNPWSIVAKGIGSPARPREGAPERQLAPAIKMEMSSLCHKTHVMELKMELEVISSFKRPIK